MARLLTMLAVFQIALLRNQVKADHFRGGIISWVPLPPNSTTGEFRALLTGEFEWRRNSATVVNVPVIACKGPCHNVTHVVTYNHTVISFRSNGEWEIVKRKAVFSFPTTGPYKIAFQGSSWRKIAGGRGNGPWNIETIVDLRYLK